LSKTCCDGGEIKVAGELGAIVDSDVATKGLYISRVVDRVIVALVVASETMLGRRLGYKDSDITIDEVRW
jgi:hypothetical protein